MSARPNISRRTALLGGAAVLGSGAIAGAICEGPRLFRHRAVGQYAGMINMLDEPDRAAIVGQAIVAEMPHGFHLTRQTKEDLAALRAALSKKKLADVLVADALEGQLGEADGWVLPRSLALLCVLAAQSA